MSNIKPMKLYLYGMFCGVSSDKPSRFPKVSFEWSRECRLGYEDEDGYWIPNTTFRLDHGDGYERWNVVYNPDDGYGSNSWNRSRWTQTAWRSSRRKP